MHPLPQGYVMVNDGDIIQANDLALGKVIATCGQASYGWTRVQPQLIGHEYFAGAIEIGYPIMLARKSQKKDT